MKFIVDQPLPPAVGGWLRQRGHEDFASRRNSVTAGPSIIWLRCGNVSTKALINLLTREWSVIESELHRGAFVIEVR